MNKFRKQIKDALSALRSRIAEAVAQLPPGDQLVVEGPVKSLISDQTWVMNRLDEAMKLLDNEEGVSEAEAEVIASAIEDGSIFKKESLPELLAARIEEDKLVAPEVVESEVAAAREEEKKNAAQQLQDAQDVAARRATAVQEHGPALMAMADSDFLAEDHEARVGLYAGRLSRLAELGITPDSDAETVEVYCSHPLDEEGEKTVAALFKVALAGRQEPADPADPADPSAEPAKPKSGSRSVMAGALNSDDPADPPAEPKKKRALFI